MLLPRTRHYALAQIAPLALCGFAPSTSIASVSVSMPQDATHPLVMEKVGDSMARAHVGALEPFTATTQLLPRAALTSSQDAIGESTAPGVQSGSYATHRDGNDPQGNERWDTWVNTTLNCTRELYWDDTTSLGLKYDLVNSDGLRGVGLWNLNSRRDACRPFRIPLDLASLSGPVNPGRKGERNAPN